MPSSATGRVTPCDAVNYDRARRSLYVDVSLARSDASAW
jgi:hypothetical protein